MFQKYLEHTCNCLLITILLLTLQSTNLVCAEMKFLQTSVKPHQEIIRKRVLTSPTTYTNERSKFTCYSRCFNTIYGCLSAEYNKHNKTCTLSCDIGLDGFRQQENVNTVIKPPQVLLRNTFFPITGGMAHNKVITVHGYVGAITSGKVQFDFYTSNKYYLVLHISLRFGENAFVFASKRGGSWGGEIRSGPNPLLPSSNYYIEVQYSDTDSQFHIYVNGNKLTKTMPNRYGVSPEDVTWIAASNFDFENLCY